MRLNIAVQMDPIDRINIRGDSTFALLLEAQARGHRLEEREPAAFRGAGDKLKRLFVEQWVTFPRYLMTGEFARAWREATTSIEDPRRPGPV